MHLPSGLISLMLKASLETAVPSGLSALMLKASLETAETDLEPKKYIE